MLILRIKYRILFKLTIYYIVMISKKSKNFPLILRSRWNFSINNNFHTQINSLNYHQKIIWIVSQCLFGQSLTCHQLTVFHNFYLMMNECYQCQIESNILPSITCISMMMTMAKYLNVCLHCYQCFLFCVFFLFHKYAASFMKIFCNDTFSL